MTETEQLLQKQIDDLEIKQAFQEQTIEELNDALTQQQRTLDKMNTQIAFLVTKLKAMEPANIASMSEETPPPHY
ncbi:SlyX protein [Grimontia hollisae]|uniref:Protein SlyX homolog n=2 Tax=Grimontia hollisae TaxID=673 RepID=D0I3Q4_GRIHO|nr:SlyX family protein [Grimontia hollisae]AMG30371.1 SlyX protein [Grimontia hollisae]EEY73682.1 putative slyX protein (slyX) [Grimontia hollisae CIP 101886]MDF2185084.1 SlyX family protein [Grimontia hollisae]STO42082.1 SlyX [Grimontia hollisae]STO55977.1 SlyX [Grimontia hollisae]